MQTQMETMGAEEESENEQSLLDSIQVENEERYDYRQFLKKFAVLREEMQTDPDSLTRHLHLRSFAVWKYAPDRALGDQGSAEDPAVCHCH